MLNMCGISPKAITKPYLLLQTDTESLHTFYRGRKNSLTLLVFCCVVLFSGRIEVCAEFKARRLFVGSSSEGGKFL